MVTISDLKNMQEQAATACDTYGYTYQRLSGDSEDNPGELGAFRTSFERQLLTITVFGDIVALYNRHMMEILMGAMIAKNQMLAPIDGEQPAAGKVGGPIVIRAAYLGVGQDWDDVGSITTGSAQNWIHSGTTEMGGTAGNAVKIGTNQVTVLIGVGSLHPSPKVESVQFTIDGKPRPIIIMQNIRKAQGMDTAFQIKEFDNAYILKKDTTVLAKIIVTSTFGTTVTDLPYLLGATFIKEDQLRVQLYTSLPGTTADVIKTT